MSITLLNTITTGINPLAVCADTVYAWVTNAADNTVSQILIVDVGIISTIAVGNNPSACSSDGTYCWVANSGDNTVSQIDATTTAVLNTITVGTNPQSIFSDGTYCWVANYVDNSVSRIHIDDVTIIDIISVGNSPVSICSDGIYCWVANLGDNTVSQIIVDTGTVLNTIPVGDTPNSVSSDGVYCWVANSNSNTIMQISTMDVSQITVIDIGYYPGHVMSDGIFCWVINFDQNVIIQVYIESVPTDLPRQNALTAAKYGFTLESLFSDGVRLWVLNNTGSENTGTLQEFEILPIANICFPKGTPVLTDQGLINIESVDPNFHTIAKNPVICVTKTVGLASDYLIRFAENCLVTTQAETTMSAKHRVFINEIWREAWLVPGGIKIPYSGETLYNILLKEHGQMNVNGIIVETLHPDNPIAKLHGFSPFVKGQLVKGMNWCVLHQDADKFREMMRLVEETSC